MVTNNKKRPQKQNLEKIDFLIFECELNVSTHLEKQGKNIKTKRNEYK